MRKISITTAQNVVIDYDLAGFALRLFAYIFDLLIILFIVFLLFIFLGFAGFISNGNYFQMLIAVPVFFFYTLTSEYLLKGQTLGKKAMKIKVININGKEPDFIDYVIRWSFRMVDIYFSLGALATILINTSPRSQRLGGLLSNTTVIKITPTINLNLNDILGLDRRYNYQPVYPQARKFSEDDMLLLKNVIERNAKYDNAGHREALQIAAEKSSIALGLEEVPQDKIEFLKTVVKDYIVLTRS